MYALALVFTLFMGTLIGVVWEVLELIFYKEIQSRIVDNIILVIFIVIILKI